MVELFHNLFIYFYIYIFSTMLSPKLYKIRYQLFFRNKLQTFVTKSKFSYKNSYLLNFKSYYSNDGY